MTSQPPIEDSLAALEAEHRGLAAYVDRLRDWWMECREIGQPRFGEMGRRVTDLADRMTEHFAFAEAGGYLRSVCDLSPDHRELVLALEREHDQLLNALCRFAELLRRTDPPFANWSEAGGELDALVARLATHERAETELIEQIASTTGETARRSRETTGAPR